MKIQLIPSGGMSLVPASIRLRPGAGPTPHSCAFNCDGLNPLDNTSQTRSHAQISNGANAAQVPHENKLMELNGGANLTNTQALAVAATQTLHGHAVNANLPWTAGSGHVRTMEAMTL